MIKTPLHIRASITRRIGYTIHNLFIIINTNFHNQKIKPPGERKRKEPKTYVTTKKAQPGGKLHVMTLKNAYYLPFLV